MNDQSIPSRIYGYSVVIEDSSAVSFTLHFVHSLVKTKVTEVIMPFVNIKPKAKTSQQSFNFHEATDDNQLNRVCKYPFEMHL